RGRAPGAGRRRPDRGRPDRADSSRDDMRTRPRSGRSATRSNAGGVPHGGRTLLSVLRSELGLTGAKEGCDDSECGACMVLLDGRPVNSCSYLALQADGREVTTIEGLTGDKGELHPLQQAFLD